MKVQCCPDYNLKNMKITRILKILLKNFFSTDSYYSSGGGKNDDIYTKKIRKKISSKIKTEKKYFLVLNNFLFQKR